MGQRVAWKLPDAFIGGEKTSNGFLFNGKLNSAASQADSATRKMKVGSPLISLIQLPRYSEWLVWLW